MYTLYYSPGTASMVVHLALLEIGAAYQLRLVDFAAGAQRDPEYLKLNAHGTVPTLLIDGKPQTESAALLMILSERHPEARLAPAAGSAERDAWLQWIVYLSNTLAATYRFWFYPNDLRGGASADSARSVATQNRERMGPPRSPPVRAWSVSARTRFLRCRPLSDHADALVAQDASPGNGMGGPEEASRPRAGARQLEKTVRTRRPHRMVVLPDAGA